MNVPFLLILGEITHVRRTCIFGAEKHSFSKSGTKLIFSVVVNQHDQTYLKIDKSKSYETNGISKLI